MRKSYYIALIFALVLVGVSLTLPEAVATLPAPTNPDPSDVGVVSDTTPVLNWGYVSRADHYEVQLDDDSYVSSYPIIDTTASYSNYTVTSSDSLSSDVYYWRVRAVDENGNPGYWSSTWSFSVITAPSLSPRASCRILCLAST